MNMQERLISERERLCLNQDQMAAAGGMKKRAYCYYESGERAPDAIFLAGIAKLGADVCYIITGKREGPPPLVLSPDEHVLLDSYRAQDPVMRKRILAFVLGGDDSTRKSPKYTVQQTIHGDVGNQAAGNIINKGKRK